MDPKFTIKPKKVFKASISGFALQLRDSVNGGLESIPDYSNRSVPHQTCLSLQKYNTKMESLIISKVIW